jgi:hypothetical protein
MGRKEAILELEEKEGFPKSSPGAVEEKAGLGMTTSDDGESPAGAEVLVEVGNAQARFFQLEDIGARIAAAGRRPGASTVGPAVLVVAGTNTARLPLSFDTASQKLRQRLRWVGRLGTALDVVELVVGLLLERGLLANQPDSKVRRSLGCGTRGLY